MHILALACYVHSVQKINFRLGSQGNHHTLVTVASQPLTHALQLAHTYICVMWASTKMMPFIILQLSEHFSYSMFQLSKHHLVPCLDKWVPPVINFHCFSFLETENRRETAYSYYIILHTSPSTFCVMSRGLF